VRGQGRFDDRRARGLAEAAREVHPREEQQGRRRKSFSAPFVVVAAVVVHVVVTNVFDFEARSDGVLQKGPGPHGRQLVGVAHQHQARPRLQRAQQGRSERGVEQGGLVDQKGVVRQRVAGVVLEGLDIRRGSVVFVQAERGGVGGVLLAAASLLGASGEEAVELGVEGGKGKKERERERESVKVSFFLEFLLLLLLGKKKNFFSPSTQGSP